MSAILKRYLLPAHLKLTPEDGRYQTFLRPKPTDRKYHP